MQSAQQANVMLMFVNPLCRKYDVHEGVIVLSNCSPTTMMVMIFQILSSFDLSPPPVADVDTAAAL